MDDLTLITCSYNTPEITMTMLKTFFITHSYLNKIKLIIIENSTNDLTQKELDAVGISYIKNPGGTHSPSVDIALDKCDTKYALLVDTDIIFNSSIEPLYLKMKEQNANLLGEVCGSRGGYLLHDRVHPWFCMIDVDFIKKHNIKFHDQKRIDETNSGYFYKSNPVHPDINNTEPYYDVGATFLEDIMKNNGRVLNFVPKNGVPFFHLEGISWQPNNINESFRRRGTYIKKLFMRDIYHKYKLIDINNFYAGVE